MWVLGDTEEIREGQALPAMMWVIIKSEYRIICLHKASKLVPNLESGSKKTLAFELSILITLKF